METTNTTAHTSTSTSENAPGDGLLTGRIALVIGASRGIGAAAARLFAREGARVLLVGRSTSPMREIVDDIAAAGGDADVAYGDLADDASIRAAVDRVVERYGRLDVAFNNGGVAQPAGPMDQVAEADVEQAYAVNLRGTWVTLSAEVAAIRATAGTGAIVNTSSVGSLRSNPELPLYAATKSAGNSLTETAAATYGPEGIRVNAIAPGTTLTTMLRQWDERSPGIIDRLNARTPLGRAADPEEIAQAAAWLLSDRASYVTGTVLRVDGGLLA